MGITAADFERVLHADTNEEWEALKDQLITDAQFAAHFQKALHETAGVVPRLQDPYPVPSVIPSGWLDPVEDVSVLPKGMKATVMPTGQVLGRFYESGTCVIDGSGECWQPLPDPGGYDLYHQGNVQVRLPDGKDTVYKAGLVVVGHSPMDATPQESIEMYNDPTRGKIIARAYDAEDENGKFGYLTGALVPGSTYADAALVEHSAMSGHWEYLQFHGGMRCLGPSMVTRPGAPLRRDYSKRATATSRRATVELVDQPPVEQPTQTTTAVGPSDAVSVATLEIKLKAIEAVVNEVVEKFDKNKEEVDNDINELVLRMFDSPDFRPKDLERGDEAA